MKDDDIEELREVIEGQFYQLRQVIEAHFDSDPDYSQYNLLEIDRHQQLALNHLYVKKVKDIASGLVEYPQEFETQAAFIWPEVAMPYSMSLVIKMGVGITLCLKTLENLGTEKHQPFIMGLRTFKDIGCFALTELAHGSNV